MTAPDEDPASPVTPFPLARTLVVAALLLLVVVMLKHAWISDDAYITFRTVRNLGAGLGPRWNLVERVQVYTHPLWMLLLAAGALVSSDLYALAVSLGIALSLLTATVLSTRIARSLAGGLLGIAVLLSSKSFVDYTTSGLENALSYALYVCFAARALGVPLLRRWRAGSGPRETTILTLLAALLATNRLDTVLMTLPVLAVHVVRARLGWRRTARALLVGALPLLLWELFSLVYYGFLVPNTAWAKLGAGIAHGELMRQGAWYYVSQLSFDPTSLLAIGIALAMVIAQRERMRWAFMFGVVLHLLYIVRIGGDFMAGRLFALPVLAAAIVIAHGWETSRAPQASVVPAAVWVAVAVVITPRPTLTSGADYSVTLAPSDGPEDPRRITDERAYYYPSTGLLRLGRGATPPLDDRKARGRSLVAGKASATGQLGASGYFAPPGAIIVDIHGLTDPLLARLPLKAGWVWRVGHYVRDLPDGYLASLESGTNVIADPKIHELYDHLARVVRDPIWSLARWKEIALFAVGRYDALASR